MTPEEAERFKNLEVGFKHLESRVQVFSEATREVLTATKNANELAVARLEGEFSHIRKDVAQILVLVRDGNGEAIASKVLRQGMEIERLTKTLEAVKATSLESTRGKWTVIVSLITGLSGLVTAIVVALVK